MGLDFKKIRGTDSEGENMLLTCNNWFMSPDGETYLYVWGRCRILDAKDILGVNPRSSVNWVWQIGDGADAVFLMGCRVNYAVLCKEPPANRKSLLIVRGCL